MRKEARLNSKGQVTVPRDIRRLLGVGTGDRLLFEGDNRGVRVRPLRQVSGFARYRGIGNPGVASGRAAVVRFVRELRGR